VAPEERNPLYLKQHAMAGTIPYQPPSFSTMGVVGGFRSRPSTERKGELARYKVAKS